MKKKDFAKFGYLFAAIVVLIIFLVYTNLQERKVEERREEALTPLIAASSLDGCSYVVISKAGEDDVELLKQDGKWYVQLPEKVFPALPGDVDDFFDYFNAIRPESVVSEDNAAFADFGVDDESGVSVRFFATKESDSPVAEVVMGKSGPDYYSVYARKAGDSRTYLIPENQSTLWNRRAKLWRDTYPFRESREDIHSIAIHTADETFTIVLGDDGFWAFGDGDPNTVNQEETVGLISRLTGLVGLSLVDDEDSEHGLDDPEWEFELGVGERTVTLSVSKEIEQKRYVRNSELDQVYEISAAPLQGIKTARKDYVQHEDDTEEAGKNTGADEEAPEE